MTANVRALTLREILDRTLKIYRAKFFIFTGIAVMPAMAYMILSTVEKIFALNHPNSGKYLLFHITVSGTSSDAARYFLAEFFHFLVYPAFVFVTVSAIRGQLASFRGAIAALRSRTKEYLNLALAVPTLIILGPALLFIGSAVLAGMIVDSHASEGFAALAKLLFVLISISLFGYVVLMEASLALSFPASAIESVAWFESIKRSWALSRGGRVRILLTWILIFVVAMVGFMLVFVPTIVIVFALHWKGFTWHGYPLYRLLTSLEIVAISALLAPIFPIALTIIYYDQRIRQEGYDIERMMEAAGLSAHITPPAGAIPIAPAEAEEAQA
ncbi:MAG: hypothetical protein ABSF70_14360 [Terracidiphilus sp.]|jgi:hypothetical protein